MGQTAKIATCCYCGTRAALVVSKAQHALVCSACGAPLSDLKNLRSETKDKSKETRSSAMAFDAPKKNKKPKKAKKKKSGFKRMFGEILDEIEDIFD